MIRLIFFLSLVLLASNCFAQTYTLNPGDQLEVSVWDEENMHREVTVLPDGSISYPLVGHLNVQGKTPQAVEQILTDKLKKEFLSNPVVTLSVTQPEGYKFFIIGQVQEAGVYNMSRPINVVQAISLAGGFTPYADKDSIIISRGVGDKQTQFIFDYTVLEAGKSVTGNIQLEGGDTIIVP